MFRLGNSYLGIGKSDKGRELYDNAFVKDYINDPLERYAARNAVLIHPLLLQSGDSPDEWAFYAFDLCAMAIQYVANSLHLPLPLHLAAQLRENVILSGEKDDEEIEDSIEKPAWRQLSLL